MTSDKHRQAKAPASAPKSRRFSKFIDKTGRYLLKPLVLATFAFIISSTSVSMAAAHSAKKQKGKAASALFKSDAVNPASIRIQSDTLAFEGISGAEHAPPALVSSVQSVLGLFNSKFPKLVGSWSEYCKEEGLPAELPVRIVNKARFDEVEDGEYSVKSVKYDEFVISINAAAPLDRYELAYKLASILSHYGGFEGETPFFYESGLVPSLAVYSLFGPGSTNSLYGQKDDRSGMDEDLACALWFAQLVGPREFVEAYASGNVGPLKEAYEHKFGSGRYYELLRDMNTHKAYIPEYIHPLAVISRHLSQIGEDPDVRKAVTPLAESVGLDVSRMP
ncbi:MAG: hypothetical protein V1728_01685 [Candidatus Micrarchaeota archaeon]